MRNIIVIGASAGGFEAIKQLTALLPPDLAAAIFIVWHMSPDVPGLLPQVINRNKKILAVNAVDHEPICMNWIYVAPPDRHLLLEKGLVRVTRGPKENRFRPAIDPLFRSAAYIYGSSVIGIILSGALDDGAAGLWTIKSRGGMAIVQDPKEAEVPSMPESALSAVAIDYRLPIAEIAPLISRLVAEPVVEKKEIDMEEQRKTDTEVKIALQKTLPEDAVLTFSQPTTYACPECHGVLSSIKEGDITRYRCHTGHAYSADSLLTAITENIEDSLWNAIRSVEESVILLNNLGDHYAACNQPKLAAMYFKKAKEAQSRVSLIRQAVQNHEKLTMGNIHQQAVEENND